ncbi:hypothetical protein CLPUN_30410 [Clostridium puniceum]|uniref:AB hydrolase-1 domain-containing protein n=1 Tax=Clostridium puniceum TaxID=29367 RepID=A0A1S8TDB2_9CLOT|nr:alpha/beta fold hydrolase [Clostridium puniceum]OOM75807.1 hypothetical protein CLPUN_30410 [Clostridium puniceum]
MVGTGSAIILAHSLSETKEIWIQNGWIEILKEHFTVIAIDLRGNGESDVSMMQTFIHKIK